MGSKVDPSFKSKRYRDKLRSEIKALEELLPVDRTSLHRKLDSQTVFRLTIAFFRTKLFLKGARDAARRVYGEKAAPVPNHPLPQPIQPQLPQPQPPAPPQQPPMLPSAPILDFTEEADSSEENAGGTSVMQALDGFLMVMTSDGTMLYASKNILKHLGFNQVDLMMRCIYGIVHPDDHQELKMVLEQSLSPHNPVKPVQQRKCCGECNAESGNVASCRAVSFLCRIKCFNGTTTGFLKMHCVGHTRSFPNMVKSQRTSNQVLFVFCRPFLSSSSTDSSMDSRTNGFWTKHGLDLRFKQMDQNIDQVLGFTVAELEGSSFYDIIHPEDLLVVRNCHKTLIHTEEIQTMYFRVQTKDSAWIWLHTRGKVVFKNSKKYSIVFTHCPVREEDSSYIQQEVVLRQRYALTELMFTPEAFTPETPQVLNPPSQYYPNTAESSVPEQESVCPSSWHTSADRHSPVFPNSQHLSPTYPKKGKSPPTSIQYPAPAKYYIQDASHTQYYQGTAEDGYCGANEQYYRDYPYGGEQCPATGMESVNAVPAPSIRQYHLHFNGIGVNPYPSSHCPPVSAAASTLVFQGHVTAIEAPQPPLHAHPHPHLHPHPHPHGTSIPGPPYAEYENAVHRLSTYTDTADPWGKGQGDTVGLPPEMQYTTHNFNDATNRPMGTFCSSQYFPLESPPIDEALNWNFTNCSNPWQSVKQECARACDNNLQPRSSCMLEDPPSQCLHANMGKPNQISTQYL